MTEDYKQQTQDQYHSYLDTDEWNKKRVKRLYIDNYTCQMCGCKGSNLNPLQVHHLDYHHIYNEDVNKDLVTLCRSCHMGIHNVMNRITNAETGQRGWKDNLSVSMVTYEQNQKKMAEQNRG